MASLFQPYIEADVLVKDPKQKEGSYATRSKMVTTYIEKPNAPPLSGPNVAALWNDILNILQDRGNEHVQKAVFRVCKYTVKDAASALTTLFNSWNTNPPKLRILGPEFEGEQFAFFDRTHKEYKDSIFVVQSAFEKYEDICAGGRYRLILGHIREVT